MTKSKAYEWNFSTVSYGVWHRVKNMIELLKTSLMLWIMLHLYAEKNSGMLT